MPTNVDLNALKTAYTRLNFEDFCAVIGERPSLNGRENEYAMNKFSYFKSVMSYMEKLGDTNLLKLVEKGQELRV